MSDLYGFTSGDLHQIAETLKQTLGITLQYRWSDFIGDYYCTPLEIEGEIKLIYNYYEGEEAYLEPDFQTYSLLLYVRNGPYKGEIEPLLSKAWGNQIELLRRQ
jgi:hypothetical protein